MLKPMLKLVRKQEEHEEDRGANAPVLLSARQNPLARRLGQASRGYVLAGAGVVVGAVGFVSLFTWLAPDSDRPIGYPLEVVGRVADGVLDQVDDRVAALLGTDGENVLQDVRENLTAVGSRTPWSRRVSEILPARSSASSGPSAPAPTARPALDAPAPEEPSSLATSESPSATSEPPQATYVPSPSSATPPSSTSETPPAAEPPATTDEPATPPPATEEPATPTPVEEPPPPTEEQPPPADEPSTPPADEPPPPDEPPGEETPPPTGPPPTTDEPTPPTPEVPPTTTN
jgi:hypothetical protein